MSDTPISDLEVRERLVDALKNSLAHGRGTPSATSGCRAGSDRQIGISLAF